MTKRRNLKNEKYKKINVLDSESESLEDDSLDDDELSDSASFLTSFFDFFDKNSRKSTLK